MWYYVLHMFQDESKKRFDPTLFRRQLLFYIVGLHWYVKKSCEAAFTFPGTMDKFLSRWKWNRNEYFYKNVILDHKPNSLANPFYQTIGIEEWSTKLFTTFGNKNNYFFRKSLKNLVMKSERFCKPLIDISEHPEPKFYVAIYRNLTRHKAIRDVIQTVMEKRFDDPNDHKGIRHVLNKKSTYVITIGTDEENTKLEPEQIISFA